MELAPSGPWVTFSDWTGDRQLSSLGTNAGATELAFQGWRKFKEAFAPEVVELAIHETARSLGRPVRRLIDPFGGSGTSALAAQFLGVHPTTIEVNPFLADLIEAKITSYDLDRVSRAFARVVERAARTNYRRINPLGYIPPTFIEPGVAGRFLFCRNVAAEFCSHFEAIERVSDQGIRRLFRVILIAGTVQLSNVVVSGKGRRYRRGADFKPIERGSVATKFKEGVLAALFDLRRYEKRRYTNYSILRGDSRVLIPNCPKSDVAVFSPPYPNSFDYTDVYNIELWLGRYLKSDGANRRLREATLRSHVQVKRDFTAGPTESPALSRSVNRLKEIRKSLWSPHIPDMVEAYFHDMRFILKSLHRGLHSGGRAYIVVGDSRYGGVHVPVGAALQDEAPALGFRVVRAEPFRSMRASPQQGGNKDLPETLVVLER